MYNHRTICILVFLGTFLPILIKTIRTGSVQRRINQVEAEILDMKRDIRKHTSIDQFAAKAKLERKCIAREKDLTRIRSELATPSWERWMSRVPMMLKVYFIATLFFTVGLSEVFVLPKHLADPFGFLLGMKRKTGGSVTASMWIFMCERAANAVATLLAESANRVQDNVQARSVARSKKVS